MKKEDLRTGDLVQYRNGGIRKVMLNTGVSGFEDVVIDSNGVSYLYLHQLERYLDTQSGDDIDIVKVFRPDSKYKLFSFDINDMELIWELKSTRVFDAELFIKETGYAHYMAHRSWVDKCHGKVVVDGECGIYSIDDSWTKEIK